MIKRTALFALWALVGFALSLELLYAFTPFGFPVLVVLAVLLWQLDRRGLIRAPEAWGLLAGPGLFCALVAANVGADTLWLPAAACFVFAAVAAFAASGRARCAAGDLDAA